MDKCVFKLGRLPLKHLERGSKKMLYCFALWLLFRIVAHNVKHFSALLPTMQKNVQLRKFFRVVGNNAGKWSRFSSCVFFSIVAPTAKKWSTLFEFEYLHEFEIFCEI